MSKQAGQWVAANLGRIAKAQVPQVKKLRRARKLTPSEQMRRYLSGEELWRVQAGLVTPEQYERYAEEMEQRRTAEVY